MQLPQFIYFAPQGDYFTGTGYYLETSYPNRVVKIWLHKSDDETAKLIANSHSGDIAVMDGYNICFTIKTSLQKYNENDLDVRNKTLLIRASKQFYTDKVSEKAGFYKKYLKDDLKQN